MVGQAKSRKESLIYVCLSYNFPENNNGQLKMKTVQNVHKHIHDGTGKLRRTLTQRPAGSLRYRRGPQRRP